MNKNLLHSMDIGVFVIANLINLLLVVIFLARASAGRRDTPVEQISGIIVIAMAVPLAVVLVINLLSNRGIWFYILPAVTIAFLILELLLDYILKVDFRSSARILTPYLILYYLNQFAMIGYCFMVGKPYGFITLVTYFINLAATFYSFTRVRHG